MMRLQISDLHKKYDDLIIYDKFSISIPENKITCLIGPSGCGKTTMLNMISGAVIPDSGMIDGLKQKNISYIFQEHRLIPWKTVYQNVSFILSKQLGKEEIRQRTLKYLSLVGLNDFKDYYPSKLSGGMAQRTAIARAFACPSDILLMDEAFKGLDYKRKLEIIEAFFELYQTERKTVLFVTHDINEALQIADEIIILSEAPVTIKKHMSIDQNQIERDLKTSEYQELSKEIYQLLQNQSCNFIEERERYNAANQRSNTNHYCRSAGLRKDIGHASRS